MAGGVDDQQRRQQAEQVALQTRRNSEPAAQQPGALSSIR
jgi:hypothetical protein